MPYVAIQHVPNFIETDLHNESAYDNVDELLKVEWVSKYENWPKFHHFCQSKEGRHLMIENEDGTWWWVVAHVTKGSLGDLREALMKEEQ